MPVIPKHQTLRLTDQNAAHIEAVSGRYKWAVNKAINRLITAGAALLQPKKDTATWLETRNAIFNEGQHDANADGFRRILMDARKPKVKRVSK